MIALAGIIAIALHFHHARRERKEAQQIERERLAYERKVIEDREKIARLREKLKHELPNSDPHLVVHHIDLDEQGRNLVERLLEKVPEPPPPKLHGDHELDVVECPEFIGYKFNERFLKPDDRDVTVDEVITLEETPKK